MRNLCTQLDSSPRLPKLEKGPTSSKDPVQPPPPQKKRYICVIWHSRKGRQIYNDRVVSWCVDTGIGGWERSTREGQEVCELSSASWWRRQWHPAPVLLPGKSHGQRSLVGCSPWGCRVRHDWATSFSLFTLMHWRRKWQPTPVLPGESQGRGSLVGCRLWGRTGSDTTEVT